MRRFVPVALALLALAQTACEASPRDRLRGSWRGERIENVDPAAAAKANGFVRATQLDFDGSRVTVAIPAETPRTGSYKISKIDGSRLTLSFQRPEGGVDEAVFAFDGEDRLRWDVGGGRQIVLRKAQN
jgi:hypothetical protein